MAIDITSAATLTRRRSQEESEAVRWTLIGVATVTLGVLVVIPLVNVFYEAMARGPRVYWNALFNDPDTLSAILLTLRVAPVAVLLNVLFGVAAAWAIARFRFPGRALLTAMIDLPFAVSPVVAGLIFVLIFGLQGYLGPGCASTTSRSSSQRRGSSWQPRSSPSRSLRASSSPSWKRSAPTKRPPR